MKISHNASLLAFNTFGIDVKADYLIEYESESDLQAVLQMDIVRQNKLLHVGTGSNLLFLSDYKGVVLHSCIKYIRELDEKNISAYLQVGAGVLWDDLVAHTVKCGYGGMENLSLIPSEVGAAVVQNIGAYGMEVNEMVMKVDAVEISSGKIKTFSNSECKYGYRDSVFKNELKGKYIITQVLFALEKKPAFKLSYQHLEEEVKKNGMVNLENIRKTIIAIRESKLPDTKEFGNAGSFFMNPVIPTLKYTELQKEFPEMPCYHISDTEKKVPAAWLIDKCGWKGKQIGKAGVHANQALVLINLGGASGTEIVHLAEQIQTSVKDRFGIELIPEVNYI